MKREKLLTITVPCYNSEGYMRECIDSLLVGGNRVEIIIIDDGSTDVTGEIADAYADRAGAYEKHFFAAIHKIGDRTAEPVYVAEVHFAVVICECRSADFYYDPFRKVDRSA